MPHLHVVVAVISLQMTDQISLVSAWSLKHLAATVTNCRLVVLKYCHTWLLERLDSDMTMCNLYHALARH